MCELSLGPEHSKATLTLEDEILRFLIGEGEPLHVAEAVRWYNYNVGAEAIPAASPFFSSDENERSKLRIQWFLNNISIPEKKKKYLEIKKSKF